VPQQRLTSAAGQSFDALALTTHRLTSWLQEQLPWQQPEHGQSPQSKTCTSHKDASSNGYTVMFTSQQGIAIQTTRIQ
jgi:hypothetical protein